MYWNEFKKLGIDAQVGASGVKRSVCPKCHERKGGNLRDKDLALSYDEGWYKCHSANCDFKGKVYQKEYLRPIVNNTGLSDKNLKYLFARGISKETILKMNLSEEKDMIQFNYFRNNELINVKTRSRNKKIMYQYSGSEKILYNLDSLIGKKKAIIVEGEIDVLSLVEAGLDQHYGIVSVDQGAPNVGDKISSKLDCLKNCASEIDEVEEWIIATDADAPGEYLKSILIDRFGSYRCNIVNFKKFKDANEVITQKNIDKDVLLSELREIIRESKPVPIKGLHLLDDGIKNTILDYYDNGYPKGKTTHFNCLDGSFSFLSGDMTLFTGLPNCGKSQFVRQLALAKSYKEGWKWACYVPEDFPVQFFYEDLCRSYVGKNFEKSYNNHMSRSELIEAMNFVENHFFCIYPEYDDKGGISVPDNEWINEKISFLKLKYGVNAYIKDPWNKIHHQYTGREDQYLQKELTKEKFFALNFDAAVYVAHPPKMGRDKDGKYIVPDIYDLAGGAMFANQVDNLIVIDRPNRHIDLRDKMVDVKVRKIKKQKLVGKPSDVSMFFEISKSRYYGLEEQNPLEKTNYIAKELETFDLNESPF